MKVKVLSDNLMVDYKKVVVDAEINLPDEVACRFIKAGLVESIEVKKDETVALIVKIDDKDVDLNKLTVAELESFVTVNSLEIIKNEDEKKAAFAKHIYDAFAAKQE